MKKENSKKGWATPNVETNLALLKLIVETALPIPSAGKEPEGYFLRSAEYHLAIAKIKTIQAHLAKKAKHDS